MVVCSYDNPDTMRREAWKDGKLVMSMSAEMLLQKGMDCLVVPLELDGHKWVTGYVWGDSAALEAVADNQR